MDFVVDNGCSVSRKKFQGRFSRLNACLTFVRLGQVISDRIQLAHYRRSPLKSAELIRLVSAIFAECGA